MNAEREKERIIESFYVYDVPDDYKRLILNTIKSNDWYWFKDCNGCSFVPNYWKTKFAPACLVHDFHWITGRGGYWSDRIFLELMKIYGFPRWQRIVRFMLVRVGWFCFYKWKHRFNGNFRKLDDQTNKIINRWKN